MSPTRVVLPLILVAVCACRTPAPASGPAMHHNDQGVRFLAQGDLDRAQRNFELAREYSPDYPEPANNLCLVAVKRAEFKKAKALCIEALRLNNDFAEAHNNLGFVYLKGEQDPARAADLFRAALKIHPGYVDARYNLCLAQLELKRPAEARVCFEKLVETNERLADAHYGLCYLDLEAGDHARAIERCTRSIQLDPAFADAYANLARAQLVAGRPCEAQETGQACVQVDAQHAECRRHLEAAASRCALQEGATHPAP